MSEARRWGTDPWRVRVEAPGVDTDRFTPGDRDAARERLGPLDAAVESLLARGLVQAVAEALDPAISPQPAANAGRPATVSTIARSSTNAIRNLLW